MNISSKNAFSFLRKNFLRRVVAVSAILALPFFAGAANTNFDPGMLITDQAFGNSKAFTDASGIQRFLEVRGSLLANTSPEFLQKLKEPADISLKNRLEDPNASLGRLRTAAELIYDTATLSQINPQVVLVTLQKEQSLIDGTFSDPSVLQRRLDRAMGFGCPDNGGCGTLFLGFYFQLFGNVDNEGNRYLGAARSLSKSFYTPGGRGPMVDASGSTFSSAPKVRTSQVNDTITVDNTQGPPAGAPATTQVKLKNAATAALYRYTPHVYNGNYNFWRFFTQWFKFGNGALIKTSDNETVYYVDNGERRPVSGTVLGQRKLDVTQVFTLSSEEMAEYPLAKPLPPTEGSIISAASGGTKYIVENSQLRQLSDFTAKLRKLDYANTIYLPDNEVQSYEVGAYAVPPEGMLVRAKSSPEISIVQSGVLRPISGFVFKQRKFKFADVQVGQDSEISVMPKGTPLPPLDGTLAKEAGSQLIYYVALGQRYPIPYFVFKLRKFKFTDVVTLGNDEIENLTLAQHLAPADGTLLKAKGDGAVYVVEASVLHWLSGFMFKYSGYKFANVVEVQAAELALIPTNSPVLLPDDSLIKITGDGTVYLLVEGSKQPLSYAAFTNRKFKFSDVIEVPAEEAARYPTGSSIVQ
ncbi:MAG: hypothetical protein M1275_01040 [Patescibacteria group bacterium]|nr:hypothetical protein [Patescibacteria group bacterium]